MTLYLRSKNADAVAEYNPSTRVFIVKKGSRVSPDISHSEKFRGAKTIEKNREQYVRDGIVIKDATFKSSSTAANFVTGRSTNGLTVWKDKNGISLKMILQK